MPIRFVFQARLKPGCTEQQYIDAWRRGSQLVQVLPGARGTIMHRSLDYSNTYMAIATWDSKEARDSAMYELGQMDQSILEIWNEDEQYATFLLVSADLGHFEEIARVNPPFIQSRRSRARLQKTCDELNDELAWLTRGYPPDIVPIEVEAVHFAHRKRTPMLRKLGIVETVKRGGGPGGSSITPTRYRVNYRSVTPDVLEELLSTCG